jgi:hypothetical protein
MSLRPYPARRAPGGDQRCLDCEHFDEDGCEQAAEALLQEGWPRATVLVEENAEADRCPEFSPNADYELAVEEEDSVRRQQLRQVALSYFARS